jgi:hypothetical protein
MSEVRDDHAYAGRNIDYKLHIFALVARMLYRLEVVIQQKVRLGVESVNCTQIYISSQAPRSRSVVGEIVICR